MLTLFWGLLLFHLESSWLSASDFGFGGGETSSIMFLLSKGGGLLRFALATLCLSEGYLTPLHLQGETAVLVQ